LLKLEVTEFSSVFLSISGGSSASLSFLVNNAKVLADSLSSLTVLNVINDFFLAQFSAGTDTLVQPRELIMGLSHVLRVHGTIFLSNVRVNMLIILVNGENSGTMLNELRTV